MRDGLRARAYRSAAPATCLDCAASTYRSVSLSRWFSRLSLRTHAREERDPSGAAAPSAGQAAVATSGEVGMALSRWVGRAIGLEGARRSRQPGCRDLRLSSVA